MPIKTLQHPDGRSFRLGRITPRIIHPHLKLKNYLKVGLPDPPETLDETTRAMPSLSKVMMNDTLGCCVISWCFGHQRGVWSANANTIEVTSDAWIERLYEVIGGYKPNDPNSDQGCQVQDALAYMIRTQTALGYVAVDATNEQEMKTAAWLFGGLTFGMGLPDAWVQNIADLNWDIAGDPDPSNGHCFGCPAKYDANLATSTWGMIGSITPAALAKYAVPAAGGECWAILGEKWIDRVTQRAPNGLDVAQLQSDLKAIAV